MKTLVLVFALLALITASSGQVINATNYGAMGDAIQFYCGTTSNSALVVSTSSVEPWHLPLLCICWPIVLWPPKEWWRQLLIEHKWPKPPKNMFLVFLLAAVVAAFLHGRVVKGQSLLPCVILQAPLDTSNLTLSGDPLPPTSIEVGWSNKPIMNPAPCQTGLQYTFDLVTWQTLFTTPYVTSVSVAIVSSNAQTFFRAENL